MKKIMLNPNPTRDIDLKYTVMVAKQLAGCGICVTVPESKIENSGVAKSQLTDMKIVPFDVAVDGADMIISLGGDGSILHTAKQAAVHNIPILGINVGRVGYMTALEANELEKLEQIISGKFTTEDRMMLDVEIRRDNRMVYQNSGLNDVVVSKTEYSKIMDLDIYTDEFFISHYHGDGVIVATPTGSTAYSMSAGGPIVDPTAENIIITPVCTHSLSAKPIVLSPERRISIQASGDNTYAVGVSVDGDEAQPLERGDTVIIRRSKLITRLVRVDDKNFYDILYNKLSDRRFGDR